VQALWSKIEPADLRWIYLTHPDRDHTGSLMEILTAAPNARLITTFLGVGILSMEYQIGLERVLLLNPGQSLDLGDRRLAAFRPPVYDSPATTGFYDQRTGTCFTSDCLGSPVTPQTWRPSRTSVRCRPMICSPGSGSGQLSTAHG